MENINKENLEHPIFKFLSPNSNDRLSLLDNCDLKEFLKLLDEYYLELRSELGLEKYITFGMEIEFSRAMNGRINSKLLELFNNDKWHTKIEPAFYEGLEIASPVLRDVSSDWNELDSVCKIVKNYGFTSRSMIHSGHIHIGANILGEDKQAWLNFMKLWAVYENIIFRFCYGECLTERPSLGEYATPVAFKFMQCYKKFNKSGISVYETIFDAYTGKETSVNFNHIKIPIGKDFCLGSTIEFRCPNGTLNSVVWQNNLNFLAKLLLYAKRKDFNDIIVNYRYDEIKCDSLYLMEYREIYLEQALELCDLIFDNNLDKVYFLRQYLKSFEIGTRQFQKSSQFTRERLL